MSSEDFQTPRRRARFVDPAEEAADEAAPNTPNTGFNATAKGIITEAMEGAYHGVEREAATAALAAAPKEVLQRTVQQVLCCGNFFTGNTHLTMADAKGLKWFPIEEWPQHMVKVMSYLQEWNMSKAPGRFAGTLGKYMDTKIRSKEPMANPAFVQWGSIKMATSSHGRSLRENKLMFYSFGEDDISWPDKPVHHTLAGATTHQLHGKMMLSQRFPEEYIKYWPTDKDGDQRDKFEPMCHVATYYLNRKSEADWEDSKVDTERLLYKTISHIRGGYPGSARNINPKDLRAEYLKFNDTRRFCMYGRMATFGLDLEDKATAMSDVGIDLLISDATAKAIREKLVELPMIEADKAKATALEEACRIVHSKSPCTFWVDSWGDIPAFIHRQNMDKENVDREAKTTTGGRGRG